MWDLKTSPCKYNIYDHDGHQLVKCRTVLGVALAWLPNPGKLLACGGTNWTQVIVLQKGSTPRIISAYAGNLRVLLLVTSPASKVEKGAQFEKKQSIWSLGRIGGRSLHGKDPVVAVTTLHRLVGLTDILTPPPFIKLQPLSGLHLVAGKQKATLIQVVD